MIRLAANLSTMFCEHAPVDRFGEAARVGFAAAELQFPYAESADELARAARDAGLDMVLINAPAGDMAAGERGLAAAQGGRFAEAVDQALDYARALACPRVHVLVGRAGAGDGVGDDTVEALRKAAELFARAGVALLLEGLNAHDQPGYLVGSIEAADALRRRIGAANVRLLFDSYHIERGGGDPAQAAKTFLPAIGHVQISAMPDRGEPDVPQVHALLETLDGLGYRGHVGCEYVPRGHTIDGLGWAERYGIGLTRGSLYPKIPANRMSHGRRS